MKSKSIEFDVHGLYRPTEKTELSGFQIVGYSNQFGDEEFPDVVAPVGVFHDTRVALFDDEDAPLGVVFGKVQPDTKYRALPAENPVVREFEAGKHDLWQLGPNCEDVQLITSQNALSVLGNAVDEHLRKGKHPYKAISAAHRIEESNPQAGKLYGLKVSLSYYLSLLDQENPNLAFAVEMAKRSMKRKESEAHSIENDMMLMLLSKLESAQKDISQLADVLTFLQVNLVMLSALESVSSGTSSPE